jgi:cytochrome c-type biogenesis protein
MLILGGFAFLAGIVTVLSPCIFPLLPIILSGSVGGGKARPWGIISGFILSFTAITLTLSTLILVLQLNPDFLRQLAAMFVIVFGLVILIPALKNRFTQLATLVTSPLSKPQTAPAFGQAADRTPKGYWSGFGLGISLGIVWTPCAGPIMASVITLAMTQSVTVSVLIITVLYSLGTAIPFLGIMLGGRALFAKVPWLTRNLDRIQQVFGGLMVLTGIAILAGWDRSLQILILQIFPGLESFITSFENHDLVQEALKEFEHTSLPD